MIPTDFPYVDGPFGSYADRVAPSTGGPGALGPGGPGGDGPSEPASYTKEGTTLALNKADGAAEQAEIKKRLIASAHMLGLLYKDPEEWFRAGTAADARGLGEAEIEALIRKRADARKAKDFATADAVRKELADKGVVIEDTPNGTQ